MFYSTIGTYAKSWSQIVIGILAACLLVSCANIIPPDGGPKDETPPIILGIAPKDSSLNIKPSAIEIKFNKYMEVKDLEKNLHVSPLITITPTVISYGKRVEIKIADSLLLPATTYTIELNDALVDNRESTPYKGFVYRFSTGAFFDSLSLKGKVWDAESGNSDTSSIVVLYPSEASDSAVMTQKPLYVTRVGNNGQFEIRALPNKAFKIFAIQDANHDYLYSPGDEKIAFLSSSVLPGHNPEEEKQLYLFKETLYKDSAALVAAHSDTTRKRGLGHQKSTKAGQGYTVQVDTAHQNKRTHEINQPLTIMLMSEVKELDSNKVYLSYENEGIEIEALHELKEDTSGKLQIFTQWRPDKLYTLRLVKGWAKDSSGTELDPGKYSFRTKSEEDYAKLIVRLAPSYLDSAHHYILCIYQLEKTPVYFQRITGPEVTLQLLEPGEYLLKIIVDDNKNGLWDPGSLLEKKQPEKVIPFTHPIKLKAGWTNEADYPWPTPAASKAKEDEEP